MTTLTARLLRRADLGTVIAALPLSHTRQWQDQLNEPGSGTVTLQADDPAHDLVEDGDVIQFLLDGTVAFAFLVRSRYHTSIDGAEAAGQLSVLAGPGLLAVLDEAVVYPSPGVDSEPVQETRLFGWQSYDYPDDTWPAAVELATVSGTRGPTISADPLIDEPLLASYWQNATIPEWPDTGAWFIWTDVDVTNPLEWAPAGTCYFRRRFTAPANTVAFQYHALFDAHGELWLDGMLLTDGDYGIEPNVNTFSGSVPLSGGDHELAALVVNDVDPEADEVHNPGALLMAGYAVDAAGNTIGTSPTVRSDGDWLVLPYPATPPGVTPGYALRKVILEAQARGALDGLTIDFTDTTDTDDVTWPVVGDISTRVGNKVLAFATELVETYLDVWVDPATFVLSAWVQDGRGTTKAVTLHAPTDSTDPMSGNLAALTHRRAL